MSKVKSNKIYQSVSSGWAFALASMVLALLFMLSVTRIVFAKAQNGHDLTPNVLYLIFSIISVACSWKLEKKGRSVLPFTGGILLASYIIWQFGIRWYQ